MYKISIRCISRNKVNNIQVRSMPYPAKSHIKKVIEQYKSLFGNEVNFDIYIAGEKSRLWPFSDQEVKFRQNRYFNYVSGAHDQPDCHVLYEHKSDRLTLFIPPFDEESALWGGIPLGPEEALKKYGVDQVKYSSALKIDRPTRSIVNSSEFPSITVDESLKTAFDEARALKDSYEVALIKRANEITDNCHLAVMSALPIETNERHIQAEFTYHAIRQGSKNEAYDPICCSGANSGILHYVKNDETMENKLNVLLDAGAEYECYASDVTRCFPINGVWSKESREIYNLVLQMQQTTMGMIKPDVHWEELHLVAHKILIEGFLRLGIFKSDFSPEEILSSNASTGFFPHGLGHMLGMDTHDTGGRANYDDPDPKMSYLRIRRTLKQDMVVTVEPGCYFNELMLRRFTGSNCKYIDYKVLDRYMSVGGIRIEDDVLVTKHGFKNLTNITSDPDEIENIVQEGLSSGTGKFHNVV